MVIDETLAKTGLFVEPAPENTAEGHMIFFASMLKSYKQPAIWLENSTLTHPTTGKNHVYARMWIKETAEQNG
jgi:hypothetical protein